MPGTLWDRGRWPVAGPRKGAHQEETGLEIKKWNIYKYNYTSTHMISEVNRILLKQQKKQSQQFVLFVFATRLMKEVTHGQ